MINLIATERKSFGSEDTKYLKRDGRSAGVLYKKNGSTQHIVFNINDIFMLSQQKNAVLNISVGNETGIFIVKKIKNNASIPVMEQVDFEEIGDDGFVVVDVELLFEGLPSEGMLSKKQSSLSVSAPATDIPTFLSYDIEGVAQGVDIFASEVLMPQGVILKSEPNLLIATIIPKPPIE